MKELPEHGTLARYRLEKRAGRQACWKCCQANADRVAAAYAAGGDHARELNRENGRRFRARQREAREAQQLAWVQSLRGGAS